MEYTQIQKGNEEQLHQLLDMWIPYSREIGSTESDTDMVEDARRRVNIQGKRDTMHFELAAVDNTMVGFCFYAVDLGGIRNVLPPNLGYIMEFYVLPQYRRRGYGSEMYRHIEATFSKHGVESIYLTPDENSEQPLWASLGFVDSGKVDPDNHLPIYIKKIGQQMRPDKLASVVTVPRITLAVWHYYQRKHDRLVGSWSHAGGQSQ